MSPPESPTPTAFVTGATGFVGREVVRQLCVRGTRCIAHVRPDSSSLSTWRTRFTEQGALVDTAAWDAAALAASLRTNAVTHLYICIGTTRSKAKSEKVQGDIYEAVDLGLTQIAVDAARASELRPRLIYLSSVGASTTARSPYLRARGKAEAVVQSSGLPWVIARPSIITGDRDESRLGERAAGVVGDGLLAVAGIFGGSKVRAKYRSTTPDILASALIRLGSSNADQQIVSGDELR
jgi:NADH dehydrogenase